MEPTTPDPTDPGAAARALLGDEMMAPPPVQALPVAEPEPRASLPPPLPELPLEFGPDLPAIRRGAAWCLGVSLIWAVLIALASLVPDLFANTTIQFVAAAILLATAVGQLQGLSLLQQIDPIHRAGEYLGLAWLFFVVMSIVAAMGFVLFQLQIDGGLRFGCLFLAWLTGVGSFWSLLFGLRRVAIYVGELRIVSESYVCQILLGFFLAAGILFIANLIRARTVQRLLEQLPEPLLRSLSMQSPAMLVTAGVMSLLYLHCLWLLWRACVRAQQTASKSG
jgi:mannose/fructose/N-acetylgalactosamine-specific phosphotransferase system component IIC